MAYSLLGAHVNTTIGGLPETIEAWKPPLVVVLDHSDVWHRVKERSPNTVFVGRLVRTDEPDWNRADLDPILAARWHVELVLPWAERMGGTYSYWQGVNEPIVGSREAMARLAAFEAERARLMDEHGFRVVVGTFSVGNPHLPYWKEFLPALEAAQKYGGALALHEYAWPTLDTEPKWYLLRHRKVYGGDPESGWTGFPAHLRDLPLLITECGLDGLIEQPHPPRGWRTLYTSGDYLAQLDWYNEELVKDAYVAGAAIYCCSSADPQWASYDIWEEPARTMGREATPIYRLGEVEPPPSPPPPSPPPPLPPSTWEIEVAYRPGPWLLVGTMPEVGVALTLVDPWGNAARAVSGAKPEYGAGGFEFLTPHVGTYTLSFSEEAFHVLTHAGVTAVRVSQAEGPVEPAPEPPPVPPLEPPVEPEPPALETTEERLNHLLARLDRMLAVLERMIG
ncbi:MAG: hypothetical protein JXA93_10425 [Anaerolineae bacterium]|nr:hypothetical protein [Anaerolineae bacterium]